MPEGPLHSSEIRIPPLDLGGTLMLPDGARSLVIFAHGSGSSRFSPRNRQVADGLNRRGHATLLFDLLMHEEEGDRRYVFDIALLADRLIQAVQWLDREPELAPLATGLFGASTGAAAALVAAARLTGRIGAVVSRGGRPDLAGSALAKVSAPTLLVVGGADHGVIELNEAAFDRLTCTKALEVIPGATHLFEEAGTLDQVIEHAATWFDRWLSDGTRA